MSRNSSVVNRIFGYQAAIAAVTFLATSCGWIAPGPHCQAQDNLFRVRANTSLRFSESSSLKVGPDTTLELSFRPMADFRPNRETEYQSLVQIGTKDNLGFAILLTSDLRSGQAKLGLVSTLATSPTRDNFLGLKTFDAAGNFTDLIVQRGGIYQVSLVFTQQDDQVDIYLDGYPQGSLRCEIPADRRTNLPWAIGGTTDSAGAFAFDGEIGGLRLWSRALPEQSIVALNRFGRGCDPTDLTMVLEYAYLQSFGDFRASTPADCRLVYPNRLAGVWRENLASVDSNVDGRGTFLDFPVYSFLPDLNGEYQVYEDANYIGQFLSSPENPMAWVFRHVERAWPAIPFSRQEVMKAGRPTTQFVCSRLPAIPRPFAGKSAGDVTLVRGSLDDDGSGINAQRFFSKAEKDRNKVTGDMTAVFLLGNNIRYKDVIYRGYNVARMNKFNLFDNGTRRNDNYMFQQPDHGLFEINVDQIRIIPKDLSINNINMGVSSAETYYVSNAMEYSQLATSRMGAGVSGSLSFGTGSASPYMVQGTINLNVVLQSESTNELQGMESRNQDKMISISAYRHYDLLHRKEMERLDPEFGSALRRLYLEGKDLAPSARETLIFEFFDTWGTHFVYGGTFGAIKWTERTIDEQTVQEVNRQSWNQYISVNEGRTGGEGALSRTLTDSLKTTSETTVSMGGNTAGDANTPAGPADEPAPIGLDLRFVSQLCSPQFFPDQVEIFTDLKTWLDLAYPKYLRAIVVAQLRDSNPRPDFAEKAQEFLDTGKWEAIEPKLYQVQVVSSKYELCSASTGAVLAPSEYRKLDSIAVHIWLDSPTGKSQYILRGIGDSRDYSLSADRNSHFIPFEAAPNEAIQVTVEAELNARIGGAVAPIALPAWAAKRPIDVTFYIDPQTPSPPAFETTIQDWVTSILNSGGGARAFALEELNRSRRFEFSPKANLGEKQTVRHLLGPFSQRDVLPACFIAVTTEYQLTRVPSTSSLWANLTATSRQAIKSNDPRFGAFLAGPPAIDFDFLSNRSTKNLFAPPRSPQPIAVQNGAGR